MTTRSKLAGIRHLLDTRTRVFRGPDEGKHSGAGSDTVIKVLDVLADVLSEMPESVAELDGATHQPIDGEVMDAGSFAARWNIRNQDERQAWFERIVQAGDAATACYIKDHEGAVNQLASIDEHRAQLRSQPLKDNIENLLADELYDGGSGPMSDAAMEQYRRNVADKLAELVGEHMSHEHTINVLRSDWDRLKKAFDGVKRYADDRHNHARSTRLNTLSSWRVWSDLYGLLGLDIGVPEYVCLKNPGCNVKHGGQAQGFQEHSAHCVQINRKRGAAG